MERLPSKLKSGTPTPNPASVESHFTAVIYSSGSEVRSLYVNCRIAGLTLLIVSPSLHPPSAAHAIVATRKLAIHVLGSRLLYSSSPWPRAGITHRTFHGRSIPMSTQSAYAVGGITGGSLILSLHQVSTSRVSLWVASRRLQAYMPDGRETFWQLVYLLGGHLSKAYVSASLGAYFEYEKW